MTKYARLQAWRLKEGKTQEQIAMELHVALSTYKGWETNSEPRTLEMTARLCQCLRMSVDYYVTGQECIPALAPEETRLLQLYNALPASIRARFAKLMESLVAHLNSQN
ncbi:MAG: helix-turn-helix domain-containing protein [Amphritea sp.]|nr:helix-turn-helix domain-containing protein [Amphritea sp.]